MARSDLAEMLVGFKADSLELSDTVLCQGAIEIFGNGVGVIAHSLTVELGRLHPQLFQNAMNSIGQTGRKIALFNFGTNRLGIRRVEDVIHVSQHGSQGQSHSRSPRQTRSCLYLVS